MCLFFGLGFFQWGVHVYVCVCDSYVSQML